MNLIFDLDDTLYDLMGPFELVHKKLYADKTDADCTELFIKSRDYSDEIMEAEIKGEIPHEDCFYEVGDLPPSSRPIFLTLPAAARIMDCPTAVMAWRSE